MAVVVDVPVYRQPLLAQLLGAKEVSDLIGVPVGTLRYWRHSDIGPASFTLGRRVVYRLDEVLRWISERENATRRGGGDAA
jgi:DNA-binding transcriptional MerR regulator